MRLSVASCSLLGLALTSKALACVTFGAFYDYPTNYISLGSLIDNGNQTCYYDGDVSSTTKSASFDCDPGYSATFSIKNSGSVAYSTPWFQGVFTTISENFDYNGTAMRFFSGNAYGC